MASNNDLIQRAQLQDALLKVRAEGSLRQYMEEAWPILEPSVPFLPNWHLDLLCEHLEAVTAGQERRLLVNIPPRYMKSLLITVLWPTWEWIRCPGRRWIFASYTESLALKHSVDRRTVLQSPWYQSRWGTTVRLAADQNEKGEFLNAARGHMIATSIGASILGRGGDRIVVDDPHNPTQIESDAQRDAAVTYYRHTLSTRLDNKKTGAIVVVMQRLHERDLSAFRLDLNFTHVCLPAEADTRTTIVFPSGKQLIREPGDLLWPAREGRAELDEQKKVLGTAMYTAQYQQQPTPAEGAIFKRDWFKFYDPQTMPAANAYLQSWDLSFKGEASSDFVVGLMAARVGANIYLMDRRKGQWSFTETCKQIIELKRQYPDTSSILVEDAANAAAVVDTLSQMIPGIVPVKPQGSKQVRAQAASPTVEASNIWLPDPYVRSQLLTERAWVLDFIDQCCAFPRGAHDDDVDAFTQLVVRCRAETEEDTYFQGCSW
jgi:predicted phage terminase large subunit-like protein